MTQKLEFQLREWGQWTERHHDWANELGENILYRAGFMLGTSGRPGSRVLCPDCPYSLRRVDKAIRRLPDLQRATVFYWYCSPATNKDGKALTKRALANELGISEASFIKRLSRARKNIRQILSTVEN